QPTPPIGGDRELAALRERLLNDDVRLMPLTEKPGGDETCTDPPLATSLLNAFTDGSFSIVLVSSGEPDALVTAIAQTVGVEESGDQLIYAALLVFTQGKRVLLLLDHFEQLSDAAPLVVELLASSQG